MKIDREVDHLDRFSLLQFLNEEEIEKLKENLFQRTYKKNQLLFTVGDPRERIYFLNEGYVKLEKTNSESTMIYIDYVKPNDIFPYGGMFKDKFYHYSAYTLTDIAVYYIPTHIFEALVQTNKDQLIFIINRLSKILELHESRLQAITTSNVKDRVEQTITYLMNGFAIEDEKGGVLIDVPMTMTEIAKIAGTTRETVSHVFKELRKDSIVSIDAGQIRVLNIDYFTQKAL